MIDVAEIPLEELVHVCKKGEKKKSMAEWAAEQQQPQRGIRMALASLKPKSEWFVKQVARPITPACTDASIARAENSWWLCTIWMRSRKKMWRSRGRLPKSVGSDAPL